jgi:hypothetical protein
MAAKPSSGEWEKRIPSEFTLALKSIKDDSIVKNFPRVRSKILSVLLFLLQSANEAYQNMQYAVEEINELCPTTQPCYVYDEEDFILMLWDMLLQIVQIIPYNYPNQELVIHFLMILRRRATRTATIWGVCVPYFLPSHRVIPTHCIQGYGGAN